MDALTVVIGSAGYVLFIAMLGCLLRFNRLNEDE